MEGKGQSYTLGVLIRSRIQGTLSATVIHWGETRKYSNPQTARMNVSEDLGSYRKRRDNIRRVYWRSGAKLTFPEHLPCAKSSVLSNWILVAQQIYEMGYAHFTGQQTEAWWANLPQVTLVSGRPHLYLEAPSCRIRRKKTHSYLPPAIPSVILHSPGTHLTPHLSLESWDRKMSS